MLDDKQHQKTILFSDQNQFDGYRSRSEWRKKTEGAWGTVLSRLFYFNIFNAFAHVKKSA